MSADSSQMSLAFATYHPEGMADNSPTFQRWDLDHPWVQVPKGRLTVRIVSRPFGTYCPWASVPNVETLGYYRESLRDTPQY